MPNINPVPQLNTNDFGDPSLLSEDSEAIDLVGVDGEKVKLQALLLRQSENGKNSIIAYVGAFGVGKSTVLKCVEFNTQGEYEWLTFETWRYANRNDLWDNFTVEVVAKFKKVSLEKAAEKVDGGYATGFEKLIVTLPILALFILATFPSYLIWEAFKDSPFASAWLKYVLPLVVSSFGLIGLVTVLSWSRRFRRPSKISRVFQFEKLLKDSLSKASRPVVIVVDDADRAGDDGAVFLETLRTFLKNNHFPRPVTVIAPQTNQAFITGSDNGAGVTAKALKIYDSTIYFSPKISAYNFDEYYAKLGVGNQYIRHLTRISSVLASDYPGQMSLRLCKFALREAGQFLERYPKANLSVAFAFALSRFITFSSGDAYITIAQGIKQHKFNDSMMHPFLVALYDELSEWSPAEVREILIFISYSDGKDMEIKKSQKTVSIDLDKKYNELLVE